jgi:DNA-binding NarL/FixJ family response regulator
MKILIVDDHTLFRTGMVHLLQSYAPPPEVVESESLQSAIHLLVADSSIDMVLLDLSLHDSNGVDSLLRMREHVPETSVVILSGEHDPEVIRACIDLGAMGFISKAATHDEMLNAINLIVAGSFTRVTQSVESKDEALLASLSDRQREVLTYLIQGKPNKTISEILNISQNTVKAHLSGIFKILGARNRTEAVYFAARAGVPME